MEALDLIINELPSPTWNHLHMNQTRVEQVVIEKEGTCQRTIPPQVTRIAAEASAGQDKESRPEAGKLARDYTAISSGMGRDMDRLAQAAGIRPEIYRVAADVQAEEPVVLRFQYEDGEQTMNRLGFETGENAGMTILMDYQAAPAFRGTGAVQTRLYAGKNSCIRLVQVQRVGQEAAFFNDIGGYCEEGGRIEILQLVLSGSRSYMGCQIDLRGDHSSIRSDIGYMVSGSRKLDINYLVRHYGKQTDCVINAGGSLRDQAEKIFRGTIDFVNGSSGSTGGEKEEVLLLDEDCINKTIPLILCAEEDVAGNHGATIGRPDEETLFYLESRGIPEADAIDMLARAKVDAVAGMIPEEAFRQEVMDYIRG